MKKFTFLLAGSAMLLCTHSALAADACASIMCLRGTILGSKGVQDCPKPIQDYFDIRKTKKGKFNSGDTYTAREKYLNTCKAPNVEVDKQSIQATFGKVEFTPGGL